MFIFSFLVLVFQIDGILFTKLKYLKISLSRDINTTIFQAGQGKCHIIGYPLFGFK